jgi:hypothetical protein
MANHLTLYVITKNPKDYPGKFVVRPQTVGQRGLLSYGEPIVGETLEEVRDALPPGLYNIGRMKNDDPVILEVWI